MGNCWDLFGIRLAPKIQISFWENPVDILGMFIPILENIMGKCWD